MVSLKKNIQTIAICALFVCMGILMCSVNSHATAYNEVEGNNYVGSADTINVSTGNTFSGYLVEDDIDWFKFTLKKGSVVNFKVVGNTADRENDSPYMYLNFFKADEFDDEFDYKVCDYDYNLGYQYLKENMYLSQGTYYVKCYGYCIKDTQPLYYTMNFTTTAWENFNEPNNYMGDAVKMVTTGKAYKGLIESYSQFRTDNEDDWFKVKPTSSGTYYITIKNIDIKNSTLYVDAYKNSETQRAVFSGKNYAYAEKGKSKTYTVTLPKANTYFKVYAYAPGKYQFSVTRKPTKVYYPDATKYGSKGIKIKWQKKDNVTGYKVYRSTKKNSGYKLITTIKTNSKTYYIDKNKTKGRTYYYKIRAYRYVNGYSCKGFYSRVESIRR